MEANAKLIQGENWSAELCSSPQIPFKFDYLGREALRIMPVASGVFSENAAIVRKSRVHERVDGLSRVFEYECVIPFGAEPLVRRQIEFAANHAKVTFDFDLKKPAELTQLETDPLFLPGCWRRFCVLPAPAPGQGMPPIAWQTITTDTPVLYQSANPFLVCLVEDADGRVLEIGAGDDLWRWSAAEKTENARANYEITASDAGIKLSRIPLLFDEKTECGKRNWRFKWYFAWSRAGETSPATRAPAMSLTAFDRCPPPESALVSAGESDSLPGLFCFHAPATERHLKKLARSAAGSSDKLLLAEVEPHVCCSAAHLDRGNKKLLRHWDLMSMLDFYLWANQLLQQTGGSLCLQAPPDSAARHLPSIAGLARPPRRLRADAAR